MINSKRKSIKLMVSLGVASSLIPKRWSNPLVGAIVLPAHAMTSDQETCSGFETEAVNEPILINVVGDEVRGPIVGQLDSGQFSAVQTVNLGPCGDDNQQLVQTTEFSGRLDSEQNMISGQFNIRQFCGDSLACEQLAEFSAEQSQVRADDDQGEYSGRVEGTLRCCVDFL